MMRVCVAFKFAINSIQSTILCCKCNQTGEYISRSLLSWNWWKLLTWPISIYSFAGCWVSCIITNDWWCFLINRDRPWSWIFTYSMWFIFISKWTLYICRFTIRFRFQKMVNWLIFENGTGWNEEEKQNSCEINKYAHEFDLWLRTEIPATGSVYAYCVYFVSVCLYT